MSIMTQSNSNPFESKVRDDKYLKFEYLFCSETSLRNLLEASNIEILLLLAYLTLRIIS